MDEMKVMMMMMVKKMRKTDFTSKTFLLKLRKERRRIQFNKNCHLFLSQTKILLSRPSLLSP